MFCTVIKIRGSKLLGNPRLLPSNSFSRSDSLLASFSVYGIHFGLFEIERKVAKLNRVLHTG